MMRRFAIHCMSRGNAALRLWLDIKIGGFWYVFMWRKGFGPYLYRSKDATPPASDNSGRWYFGRPAYYKGA